MTLEIITPNGHRGIVKADDEKDLNYYLKWVEKGYVVKELKVTNRRPFEECEACSS